MQTIVNIAFYGGLTVIGCVLAGLLGFWARNSKRGRYLKAIFVSLALSWTMIGANGIPVMLPSVVVFYFYFPEISRDFVEDRPLTDQHGGRRMGEYLKGAYFAVGMSSFTLTSAFGSFYFFSRKPKPSIWRGL